MERNEIGGLAVRAARHAKAATNKPSRFSAKQKVAAFIAGAIITIGGGAGGFVVIHGGGGGGGSCVPSFTIAAVCSSADIGTDLEINVSTHADNTTNYIACTNTTWLAYAQAYSRGVQGVDYTRTGSGWPVKIALNFAVGVTDPTHNGMDWGCKGDGNPNTFDIFPCIQGNGTNTGFGNDVMKISGASSTTSGNVQAHSAPDVCGSNIQGRTGGINDGPKDCGADGFCGGNPSCPIITGGVPQCGGDDAHQDCIQIQGGNTVQFFDSVMGDYGHYKATCAGSGGALWINAVQPTSYCTNVGGQDTPPHGCAWIRGHAVSCNHGLNAKITSQTGVTNPQNSVGIVTDSIWRVGAPGVTGTDGWFVCSAAAASNNLATEAPSWTFTNNTTETYCLSGTPTYCVNHGGSGFPTTNDAF